MGAELTTVVTGQGIAMKLHEILQSSTSIFVLDWVKAHTDQESEDMRGNAAADRQQRQPAIQHRRGRNEINFVGKTSDTAKLSSGFPDNYLHRGRGLSILPLTRFEQL